MVKFPCKGCTDRVLCCHSTCEKYLTCRKEQDSLINTREKELILRRWDYGTYQRKSRKSSNGVLKDYKKIA